MRAGWYEQNGPAKAVLKIGERSDPEPAPGEAGCGSRARA